MIAQALQNDSIFRQATHWQLAAKRMLALENLASQQAWHGVDHTIAQVLKKSFTESISEVIFLADQLIDALKAGNDQKQTHKMLLKLRNKYTRAEETVHYYTIAINSRINPSIGALLRACDLLCKRSMEDILKPLGKDTPLVMTFVDKGIGASILKAGLRLWDGKISPVAAIKITQHNLYRPTAIIHETGHQVAHILNWTSEIESVLTTELKNHGEDVANAYAGWSSEMAADAFAFVHTGFAAVAALHDVVSGNEDTVFTYHRHDPHPISYVRVLLNIEMCKLFFGYGPWNHLEESFVQTYNIESNMGRDKSLILQCKKAASDVAKLLLSRDYKALDNKSLSQIINPMKVSPKELEQMEREAGPSLYTSHAWIAKESLRILALNGYKIGATLDDLPKLYKQQEEWMTKLGFVVEMN